MTPIREQIIQALATRTGAVRFNDGQTISEMELPATVILVQADERGANGYDMTEMLMPVTIARAIGQTGLAGDDWHVSANEALANLVKEIYTPDIDAGGLITQIVLTGQSYDVQPDGAQGYVVQAELEIQYQFAIGDPFTQEVI